MELFWKKKEWLAYALAVLVFTLHLSSLYQYGSLTEDESYLYPLKLFKMCVSRVAVPSFFILSASIFFRDFSVDIYRDKIRSRWKSLIIPYLSWNTIYLIFSIIATLFFSAYFIERKPMDITLVECVKAILFYSQNGHFWFIFDLIVFFLVSPIVYYLLRNKYIGIVAILGITILLIIFYPTTSYPSSFFYLMIGAYIGTHHFQWMSSVSKIKIIGGLIGVILCITLLYFINDHEVMRIPVLTLYSLCLFFAVDIFDKYIINNTPPCL